MACSRHFANSALRPSWMKKATRQYSPPVSSGIFPPVEEKLPDEGRAESEHARTVLIPLKRLKKQPAPDTPPRPYVSSMPLGTPIHRRLKLRRGGGNARDGIVPIQER